MTLRRDARTRAPGAPRAAQLPLLAVALALVPASCGGGAAPALQAPAAPALQAPPQAPPAPDVAAVPEPPALVVSGRVGKPSAILSTARAWSRLPMPQSDEVSELVTGDAVGPLVDLDQPVDFAVSVAGSGLRMRARAAVSVALKDPERAKAALADRYKLTPGENGVLYVQGLGRAKHGDGDDADGDGDDDASGEESRSCAIAPAYGPSGSRLVCAWGPKALSELAPWLTRTATRASFPSDVHVDLRMAPLRATIAAEKRALGAILETELGSRTELPSARDVGSSLCDAAADFVIDLDTIGLDFDIGEPRARATANLKFATTTSALTRIAVAHADQSGPPPAAFLQLPADADVAFFDRGIDESDVSRARDLVLRLLGDGLASYGLKDADRKPLLDAFAKMTSSAGVVYASGLDMDAATKAIAAAAARSGHDGADAAGAADAERAMAEALLGWRLVEVEEPAVRWVSALKDLAAALGRPSVAAAYRAKVVGGVSPPVLRLAPLPKGAVLPPATVHYVLDVYPVDPAKASAGPGKAKGAPAAAHKPLAFEVFVVPEGDRTWIAMGGGEAFVASKAAAAIAPAGDKLGDRAEIAPLKEGGVGAGGFITIRALPEAAPQLEALLGTLRFGPEAFDDLAQLPHRGAVPVTFSVTARPGATPPPVALSLNVPRAVIEDVVAGVLRHGGF